MFDQSGLSQYINIIMMMLMLSLTVNNYVTRIYVTIQ